MRHVHSHLDYAYWVGVDSQGDAYYNLTKIGDPPPNGGYYSSEYICKIKGVPNYFNTK